MIPFLWDPSHLLLEGSGVNESEFLGLTEAFFFFFSVEELTKQRNWEEEAETAESCLERVRRNNPVAISEQI